MDPTKRLDEFDKVLSPYRDAWRATFSADDADSPDFGIVPDGFTIPALSPAIPSWHREPIKRLRVEWARWKARR